MKLICTIYEGWNSPQEGRYMRSLTSHLHRALFLSCKLDCLTTWRPHCAVLVLPSPINKLMGLKFFWYLYSVFTVTEICQTVCIASIPFIRAPLISENPALFHFLCAFKMKEIETHILDLSCPFASDSVKNRLGRFYLSSVYTKLHLSISFFIVSLILGAH